MSLPYFGNPVPAECFKCLFEVAEFLTYIGIELLTILVSALVFSKLKELVTKFPWVNNVCILCKKKKIFVHIVKYNLEVLRNAMMK